MFARLFPHSQSEDHRRLLQLLEDASEYPGLPRMEAHSFRLMLSAAPCMRPLTSWNIFADANDRYRIRRVRWDLSTNYNWPETWAKRHFPTAYGADAEMDAASMDAYLGELAALEQPSLPLDLTRKVPGRENVRGSENRYGLRLVKAGGSTEIFWADEPPAGYEAIAGWYHRFLDVLESRLPAHTTFKRNAATYPFAITHVGDEIA